MEPYDPADPDSLPHFWPKPERWDGETPEWRRGYKSAVVDYAYRKSFEGWMNLALEEDDVDEKW